MKILGKLAAAAASVGLMVGPALAADPMPVVVPMVTPVVVAPVVHDWDGIFFGTFGMIPLFAGAQVGYNFTPGNFLVGVTLRGGALVDSPPVLFSSVSVRAGLVLGAQDRAVVYGTAGLVGLWNPGVGVGALATFGGGAEFAVNDRLSVFGETRATLGAGCCLWMMGINLAR
ncbi:MAG: hypothetical protein KIT43_14435 [Bauldia sp.]|nr:hypothetical protein [Bauldia sp.]MCW5716721.1 hypothetical protein [Bauldia sp.]